MALQTPKAIVDDFIISDSNEDGIAGILLPLNQGDVNRHPLKGKLQVRIDEDDDLPIIRDIILRQPKAQVLSAYQVDVSIYIASSDRLITFPDRYGLDCVAALVSFVSAADMQIRWAVRQ